MNSSTTLVFNETNLDQDQWLSTWRRNANFSFLGMNSLWFVVSAICSLVVIGGICAKFRGNGYFQLLSVFSVFHVLYFAVHIVHLLLGGIVDSYALSSPQAPRLFHDLEWIPSRAVFDFEVSILGPEFLLLAIMTLDVRIKNHRPRRSKCIEGFIRIGLVSISIIVSAAFAALVVLRHGFSIDLGFTTGLPYILVFHATALSAFIVLPAFVIVITGAVNWVSNINSGYPKSQARHLMNELDASLWRLTSLLLLLTAIKWIADFAIMTSVFKIDYRRDVITALSFHVFYEFATFIFAIYPILILSKLWSHVCCSRRNKKNWEIS